MCEIDKVKQSYLLQAFPEPLLFADMKELGKRAALDVRSGETKSIPSVPKLNKLKLFRLLVVFSKN